MATVLYLPLCLPIMFHQLHAMLVLKMSVELPFCTIYKTANRTLNATYKETKINPLIIFISSIFQGSKDPFVKEKKQKQSRCTLTELKRQLWMMEFW